MKILPLVIALLCLAHVSPGQWVKQSVNTTASFRGLSVVNEKVIWASGTEGTVIRTIDGGKTWKVMNVPGGEKLDFRDIEAFDQFTAYVLSIGNGENSRVYKTTDGGKTWTLEFKNTNEKAFFDAIACADRTNCIAMSDPVDGTFLLVQPAATLKKIHGPPQWEIVRSDFSPKANDGEAAFAASGTCLIRQGFYKTFIVSGGSETRVHQRVYDGPWTSAIVPFTKGTTGSGIFSIAMYDLKNGVIVGGNYEKPNEAKDNLAFTIDGGKTWKLGTGLTGYRSGVAYIDKKTIIAVGTNGSDISRDVGETWLRIDGENYNSVQAKGKNAIWAVGPKGYVAMLGWQHFLAINGHKPCAKNMICDAHANIDDLRLSHVEISSACPQSDSSCSHKRQIEVSTLAPDVSSGSYDDTASGGQIIGFGPKVIWDLSDAKPGKYTITAGVKVPFGDSFRVFGRVRTEQVIIR